MAPHIYFICEMSNLVQFRKIKARSLDLFAFPIIYLNAHSNMWENDICTSFFPNFHLDKLLANKFSRQMEKVEKCVWSRGGWSQCALNHPSRTDMQIPERARFDFFLLVGIRNWKRRMKNSCVPPPRKTPQKQKKYTIINIILYWHSVQLILFSYINRSVIDAVLSGAVTSTFTTCKSRRKKIRLRLERISLFLILSTLQDIL